MDTNNKFSFEVANEIIDILLENVSDLADVAKALQLAPSYANNKILKKVELN